jgi:hypothetical protein
MWGLGIRNCTKTHLGIELGIRVDNYDYKKIKIKYQVLIYNCCFPKTKKLDYYM